MGSDSTATVTRARRSLAALCAATITLTTATVLLAPAARAATTATVYSADGNALSSTGLHDGTWSGVEAYVQGATSDPGDQAFDLDGSSAVTMDTGVVQFGLHPVRVSFQFKTSVGGGVISTRATCTDPAEGWFSGRVDTGNGAFDSEWGGSEYHAKAITGDFRDGAWHAVVMEHTAAGFTTTVDAGTPATQATSAVRIEPTAPLTVGASPCGSYTGAVDDLRIQVLPPTVVADPTNAGGGGATPVSLTAGSDDPDATVAWEVSTDGGTSYATVSGATSTTYGFTPTASGLYRAVFTGPGGTATTQAATVSYLEVPSVTDPDDVTAVAGSPASFTVTASGSPSPTVQWESSTDGGASWTDLTGATALTYSQSAVTYAQTGTQYRAVVTNSEGTDTSAAATLTVTPTAPAVTTHPSSTTVASGAGASFTAAAGGDPAPTVQWQRSTDGGTSFTDVTGATSPTYAGAATAYANSGEQFRAVFTSSAGSATTTAATLTVTAAAPVVTTHPSSTTVASGAGASFTAGASGDPTATVQWQRSTDSGASFTDITEATSLTYAGAATAYANSGDRFRAVFTNTAGSATTNAATLTVTAQAPAVLTDPSDVTVASGAGASFSAVASGDPVPTVQWQRKASGAGSFTNISGATSATYTAAASAYANSGDQFRAVFTNIGGSATTAAATLTVTPASPVVTTNPGSTTVASGAGASFTAAASADPAATVQWQRSTDAGASFTNISGATSATYAGAATAFANSGDRFRAVFTNLAGTATTTAATLTVTPAAPVVTTQPSSTTVASGTGASFTAAASGDPAATVQWQRSTDGGATYSSISGATSATYAGAATAYANSGDRFRAVFTNVGGSATTNAATLTVTAQAPAVLTDPSGVTVASGAPVTFSAVASGDPVPAVQWQRSTDGGASFSNISGATSATYAGAGTTYARSGDQFRAVFTNVGGSATTAAATLTVTPAAPVVTTNPASTSVASGAAASFLAAATADPAATVQWQRSTDGGVSFTNIAGATATTYGGAATAYANNGDEFRAVFTNLAGSATTTPATLTVSPRAPTVTTNPASASVANGVGASFSAAGSGDPVPTVKWQRKPAGGSTFTDIPGATSTTYAGAATAYANSGDQFRAVFTNLAGTVTTTAATLTVAPAAPAVTANPSSTTVASGASPTFTATASGDPTPTVQWQRYNSNSGNWADISGATSGTYTVVNAKFANTGTLYRAVFSNPGGTATTAAATLTVNPAASTVTTQPVATTVASAGTATFTANATGDPVPTVQWQKSSNGGTSFGNIANATATTLTLTAVPYADNGALYRAVFTNAGGTATTNAVTLTVTPAAPQVLTPPADVTASSGTTATVNVTSSGDPVPSVQWQKAAPGSGTFADVAGATSTTLSVANVRYADSGTRYRAVLTNVGGTVTTTAATLTVTPAAPSVLTDPSSTTAASGGSASFSAVASGDPVPTVQWQKAAPGSGTFSDLPGETAATLSVSGLVYADTGTRYRARFTNVASSATTAAATLTVTPATPVVTTAPAAATVASAGTATFTAAASGDPVPTVQWQVSAPGSTTFADLSGETSTTLSVPNVRYADGGTRYRAVFSNVGGTVASAPATLTVTAADPVVTADPAATTIASAATATLTAAASGDPVPTVQWQRSAPGSSTFADVPGATSATYVTPSLLYADSGTRYRAVFTNVGASATTQDAAVTVSPRGPTVSSQPADTGVVSGSPATFTAEASSDPVSTVQWQRAAPGSSVFSDVAGATGRTLSVTPSTAQDGSRYRAVFTNPGGTATSRAARMLVSARVPDVTSSPVDATTDSGVPASFTASADADPTPTVQWERSNDAGVSWAPVAGATTTTLTFTPVAADSGSRYRAVFTNVAGDAATFAARLTVRPLRPTVTTQPTSTSVVSGSPAGFSAAASSDPAATVRWQRSNDGGSTWTDVPGATAASYVLTPTVADDGARLRAVFTNAGGSTTTSPAVLTVTPRAPVVVSPPADGTTAAGVPVSFSVTGSGDPSPTVQWQRSTNGGTSFTDVPGETAATLTVTPAAADDDDRYRAVLTNAGGTATSTAARLHVGAIAPTVTAQPADATVRSGSTVTLTAAGTGDPVPTMQWNRSTDGGATWVDLVGQTGGNLVLQPTTADAGSSYRAVFSNGVGTTATRSAVLTVTALAPSVSTQPVDRSTVSGTAVTFTAAATGDPAPSVLWSSSRDGGVSFTPVDGATSPTLVLTPSVADDGLLLRAVFSSSAGADTTRVAALSVAPAAPVVTAQPVAPTVVSGTTATLSAAASGDPVPTVRWQRRVSGGSFVDVASTTTFALVPTTVDDGAVFRAVFTNTGGTATTATTVLRVTPSLPQVTSQPSGTTVRTGSPATFTVGTSGDPLPSVAWRRSTDGGATYTVVPGATSTSLTVSPVTADDGTAYQAVLTNTAGSVSSIAAVLHVLPLLPVVVASPGDVTVASGGSTTLIAQASGEPTPTVRWQRSTDGLTFTDVAGANSASLSLTGLRYADSGTRYRALFTNAGGVAATGAATVTVPPTAVVVTSQPSSTAVPAGAPASFTAVGTADPVPSVQWQRSSDNGATWTDVAGATTGTLALATTSLSDDGSQLRAVFSGPGGTATSAPATLGVSLPVVVPDPPAPAAPPTAPVGLPGAPQSVLAVQTGAGTITLTWSAPLDQGASAVTSYELGVGGASASEPATAGSHVFSGLAEGTYAVSVGAVNGQGAGTRGVVTVVVLRVPTLALSAARVVAGTRVTATGTGSPGTRLVLERALRGRPYAGVAAVVVGSDGRWSLVSTAAYSATYRVRTATGLVSPQRALVAVARVTATATRTAVRTYALTGTVYPGRARQSVKVYDTDRTGRTTYLGAVLTDTAGRWSYRRVLAAGAHRLRATSTATVDNASGTTVLAVTVR